MCGDGEHQDARFGFVGPDPRVPAGHPSRAVRETTENTRRKFGSAIDRPHQGDIPSTGYEADLIYDVGLHRGEDSEFYLKKGFRVVAIEAVPALAQAAEARLRDYVESGRLVILNVAVAKEDGPLTFFENPGTDVWGTASAEWAQRNDRLGSKSIATTVQGANFSNILRRFGVPYYLKVDIEGADLLCLEALKQMPFRPRHVSIESTKGSWDQLMAEFRLLGELGYRRFKVVPQHEVKAQTCPWPAPEGEFVAHTFEEGASGLFGDEAPGEWLDERQAKRAYRPIFRSYRLAGDSGIFRNMPFAVKCLRRLGVIPALGWYDTHATTA